MSSYKPTGEMTGNTSRDKIELDSPNNSASYSPTTHPSGVKFLSYGEGADSAAWNRAYGQLGRNIDAIYNNLRDGKAVPRVFTSTDFATLAVGAATGSLALTGTDAWIYHARTAGDLPKLFRLVDDDGMIARGVNGEPVVVTDVQLISNSNSVLSTQDEQTLVNKGVNKPEGTDQADPRHQIELASAVTQIGTASYIGLRTKITGNTVVDAKGTNNGKYVITSEIDADDNVWLGEYRHRIRYVTTSGNFQAETVTSASGTMVVATSDDFVDGEYMEADSVTGTFLPGETITGGTSSAEGTVLRYSKPGDPVILNNNVTAATGGTAAILTDGYFSHTDDIKLIVSPQIQAGEYRLICGVRGTFADMVQDQLIYDTTDTRTDPTQYIQERLDQLTLQGAYDGFGKKTVATGGGREMAVHDKAIHVHGDTEVVKYVTFTYTSANAAFREREVIKHTTSGGDILGEVVWVEGGRMLIDVQRGAQVLDATDVLYGMDSAATADVDTVTASLGLDRNLNLVLTSGDTIVQSPEDPDTLSLTGSRPSALEVLSSIYSVINGVQKLANATTYSNADDVFTVAGSSMAAAMSAAGDRWGGATEGRVVEIFDADDAVINGFYEFTVTGATFTISRISNVSGQITTGLPGGTRNCKSRFWARNVFLRGYRDGQGAQVYINVPDNADNGANTDYATAGLLMDNIGGNVGIDIENRGLTAGTGVRIRQMTANSVALNLLYIRDESGTTDILKAVTGEVAGNSDDSEFVDMAVVHSDTVRSSGDKRAAGANGTRVIDMSTAEKIRLRIAETTGTLDTVAEAERSSATDHRISILAPGGGTAGSGEEVGLYIANDFSFVDLGAAGDPTMEVRKLGAGAGAGTPIMLFKYDGGGQEDADAESDKPLVHVPDIRYGGGAGSNGKVVRYQVPLTSGHNGSGDDWYASNGGETITTMKLDNTGSGYYLVQVPPYCRGSSTESTARYLQKVEVRVLRPDSGTDTMTVELFYSDVSDGIAHRIAKKTVSSTSIQQLVLDLSHTGTAQAGGADNEIILESGEASVIDDTYNGWTVDITGGTGSGQQKTVNDYDGGSITCTVDSDWSTNPNGTSTYTVTKTELQHLDGRQFYVKFSTTGGVDKKEVYEIVSFVRTTMLNSAA